MPPTSVAIRAVASQYQTSVENPGIGSDSQRIVRMDSSDATTDNDRSCKMTSRLPFLKRLACFSERRMVNRQSKILQRYHFF